MRYLYLFIMVNFIPTAFTRQTLVLLTTKFTLADFDSTEFVNAIYIYCLRSGITLTDRLPLRLLIVN